MNNLLTKYVDNLKIKLGYACINKSLCEDVLTSRTLTIASLKKLGVDAAKQLSLMNINDMIKIMQYNFLHGIYVYRITSNLFPHSTNNLVPELNYGIGYARGMLELAGKFAKKYHQRITMHIGQYAQIASPNKLVYKQTIKDLTLHAQILDYMKLDLNSVIVIHVGGVYNDKYQTMIRWIERFTKIPERIKRRLVIENDELYYNVNDVLTICEKINRPMVFDYHHYMLNPVNNIKELLPRIIMSWTKLGLKPKFHLSEANLLKKFGAHADYIKTIPKLLLDIPKKNKTNIDVMIEAKMKDKAVKKLHNKFFDKKIIENVTFYDIRH